MSRDREWDRNSRGMRVGREQGAGVSLLTITNRYENCLSSLTHHGMCLFMLLVSVVLDMLLAMGAITELLVMGGQSAMSGYMAEMWVFLVISINRAMTSRERF